jgi:hypothetical protein
MNQQELIAVNLIILEDCQRINQQFIKEATRQWDAIGQGRFAVFIEVTVNQMWVDMVKRN